MIKRIISIIVICMMLVGLYQPVHGSNNIWSVINEAGLYEANGALHKALPLWLDIVEHFEQQPASHDSQTNIAIFSKKIGKYYDSEKQYDLAVQYYEKENENWLATDKPWGAEDMLRAEAIRTEVALYAEVEATDVSLAPYEPASGVYLGIYSELDKDIGQKMNLTKNVYGRHASYILYQDWNQNIQYGTKSYPLDVPLAQTIKEEDAALHLVLNAMNGLETVEKNDWIVNWAKEAKKLDMPIFLRLFCEMNGDWVPWHGDPELFIEKWRMVHDVMAVYAPNVVMVWTPNDAPVETSDGIRIEDYYPGDDYVDWVGVNFYTDYYNSGQTEGKDNHLSNPLSHLDYIYDMYSDKKPIMIGETGVAHYSIPNSEDVTPWAVENIKKFYGQLYVKYPRVKAIHYFSVNQMDDSNASGSKWSNYSLAENDSVKEAYKTIIDSPYYLGKIETTHDKTYVPIEPFEAADYKKITAYAKISDYKISKIEFYNEEKLLGMDETYPFELESDLSDVYYLTLKIYGAENTVSLIKKFNLVDIPVEPNPLGAPQYHQPFVSGDLSGHFRPDDPVTRAEMVTMISKVMPMRLGDFKLPFDDIVGHWSMIDIMMVRSAGLISGEDNNFRPDEYMTRAEAAALFRQYMMYTDKPYASLYDKEIKDLADDHWATYAIRTLIESDLMSLSDGYYYPDKTLSRKEAVYIINRLTGRNISGPAHSFDDVEGMWHRELNAATSKQLK